MGFRVQGVEAGVLRFDVPLAHGQAPEVAAYEAGFVLERPLDADRDESGDLVLRAAVRPRTTESSPARPSRGRDADLVLGAREVVRVRQRIGAYAVVVSARGLLATEYSGRTAAGGRWGLPGGGIDPGERPVDTVRREVHEETAQEVVVGALVTVQSSHWVGRSPGGVAEDFHAVRLVYRADCPNPTDVRVLDAEGTTSAARWVPVADWRAVGWAVGSRQILADVLG